MPMASECVETFPAELKQFVALWLRHAGLRPGTAIAQLVAADQAVVAIAIGVMPLKVNPAHHALPRIRWATSCSGAGLRRPSSSISMSGWSMGLMRLRSAMNARRRSKAAEGLLAME